MNSGTPGVVDAPLAQRLISDTRLHGVLLGTLCTAMALWWWLPAGFAADIVRDPWRLLAFLLVYPVLEEWLFRGLLQGELMRFPWGGRSRLGVTAANGFTTAAFVLLHLVHHPVLWALSVAVPSLVLGYFRERYGRLWLPMTLHIIFNLAWLLAGLPWPGPS